MRVKVIGAENFQDLLRDLPVRTDRGRKQLLYEAARKLRTPVRRAMRNNIPTRPRGRGQGLKRSLRVTIGSRRKPTFVVRGRNYLVPFNARSGAISSELEKLPGMMEKEIFEDYEKWLRNRSRQDAVT